MAREGKGVPCAPQYSRDQFHDRPPQAAQLLVNEADQGLLKGKQDALSLPENPLLSGTPSLSTGDPTLAGRPVPMNRDLGSQFLGRRLHATRL